MKQIKILTVLIVLFFVGVTSRDIYAGFLDGWNEQSTVTSQDMTVSLGVRTVDVRMCDSVYNASLQCMVQTAPDSLRVGVDMSDWDLTSLLPSYRWPFSASMPYSVWSTSLCVSCAARSLCQRT